MFEMQSMQTRYSTNYMIPVEQANALRSEGYTPREIARLMAARTQSVRDELNEASYPYTRFRLAISLYQSSQIKV